MLSTPPCAAGSGWERLGAAGSGWECGRLPGRPMGRITGVRRGPAGRRMREGDGQAVIYNLGPRARRVYDTLRARIESGELTEGDQLPSYVTLATQFGVA